MTPAGRLVSVAPFVPAAIVPLAQASVPPLWSVVPEMLSPPLPPDTTSVPASVPAPAAGPASVPPVQCRFDPPLRAAVNVAPLGTANVPPSNATKPAPVIVVVPLFRVPPASKFSVPVCPSTAAASKIHSPLHGRVRGGAGGLAENTLVGQVAVESCGEAAAVGERHPVGPEIDDPGRRLVSVAPFVPAAIVPLAQASVPPFWSVVPEMLSPPLPPDTTSVPASVPVPVTVPPVQFAVAPVPVVIIPFRVSVPVVRL